MAISYNRLGSNGRLGNQMFQYAGLRGIASKKGYEWLIPPDDSYGDSNYGLFDCFQMESVTEKNFGYNQNVPNIASGCFHYSEEFVSQCPDNVNIHDYLTTEKYFSNIRDEIKKDFTFKKEILSSCKEIIETLDNPIFIHVRRGDYSAKPDAHPTLPIKYYQKALKHFDENCDVVVFSDDMEWVKQQKFFSSDRFKLSEFDSKYETTSDTLYGRQKSLIPYYDLCMMTLCNGAIIANSTMSWWGAYLQTGDNPIIAPNPWFGPMYDHYNMNDLLPSEWTVVNYG